MRRVRRALLVGAVLVVASRRGRARLLAVLTRSTGTWIGSPKA